ncbi:MAG: hypothetical protein KY475_17985 [Planctomycetes bacterium]|nr:hypothetical protein [Planctomycetota bacterium]
MQFVKKILDITSYHSKDDLVAFRSVASSEYPAVVPLIDEYIRLAKRADTEVSAKVAKPARKRVPTGQMHLFDLLRDKRLFSSNAELAEFAEKILPNIKSNRFDKMARGDIAARIIEYIESKDRRTREELEASMREAVESPISKPSDKKSFASKWEAIIKGIEL